MFNINQYFEKAQNYIQNGEIEEAITSLIVGLEHGYVKCAYGIINTVMNHRSYTMTEDEAVSIFNSSYSKIKLLAEEGDTEAMVMVAEGIRYGFVDDCDEPYLFWLTKAAGLGDKTAIAIIMNDLELSEDQNDTWALPSALAAVTDEACADMDSTDMLLLDVRSDFEFMEAMEDSALTENQVLVDAPDWVMREQYGINDYYKEKERQYELRKCRDDQAVD